MLTAEFRPSYPRFVWRKPMALLARALVLLLVVQAPSYGGCHPMMSFHEGDGETQEMADRYMCAPFYMEELYNRMFYRDQGSSSNGTEDYDERVERILCFIELDSPHVHRIVFNISMLDPSAHITMARIAVTTDYDEDNSCRTGIKGLRTDEEPLPCEDKPFGINNLATFDVTSLLTANLGKQRFHVHVQNISTYLESFLIVFSGIDAESLFHTPIPAHVRTPVSRLKREASAPFSHPDGRQGRKLLGLAPLAPKGNDDSADGHEYLTGREFQTLRSVRPHWRDITGKQRFKGLRNHSGGKTSRSHDNPRIQKRARNSAGIHMGSRKGIEQHRREGQSSFRLAGRVFRSTRSQQTGHDLFSAKGQSVLHTHSKLQRYLHERRRRSVAQSSPSHPDSHRSSEGRCQVVPLMLDPFHDLGIATFIAPRDLDIRRCSGTCPPILHPNEHVTHNSYVMSLMHFRTRDPENIYPAPSCRPRRFESFPVYRFLGPTGPQAVVERWRDARVVECGCV